MISFRILYDLLVYFEIENDYHYHIGLAYYIILNSNVNTFTIFFTHLSQLRMIIKFRIVSGEYKKEQYHIISKHRNVFAAAFF